MYVFLNFSSFNHTIGKISDFVGVSEGNADGIGANAKFYYPCSLTIDQQTGDLYVIDYSNYAIRKVTQQGTTLLYKYHIYFNSHICAQAL